MALTTRPKFETYVGSVLSARFTETQKDDAVAYAIDLIEQHTDRIFEAGDYTEWISGNNYPHLFLQQYPVIRVNRACSRAVKAAEITCDHPDSVIDTVSIQDGVIHFTIRGGEAVADQSLTLADYSTMADLAAAVGDLNGDWTMEVIEEGFPPDLRPDQSIPCHGTFNGELFLPDPDSMLPVHLMNGSILSRDACDWSGYMSIFLDYRAGFEEIPPDLERIANEIARDILLAAKRDKGITSERIGDYSYTTKAGQDILLAYQGDLNRWTRT